MVVVETKLMTLLVFQWINSNTRKTHSQSFIVYIRRACSWLLDLNKNWLWYLFPHLILVCHCIIQTWCLHVNLYLLVFPFNLILSFFINLNCRLFIFFLSFEHTIRNYWIVTWERIRRFVTSLRFFFFDSPKNFLWNGKRLGQGYCKTESYRMVEKF